MSDFYRTLMGKRFYEHTMPELVKQLQKLNDNLEKSRAAEAALAIEEIGATAAYLMRERCAEEADKLYGEQAAGQIRQVPLPHEV